MSGWLWTYDGYDPADEGQREALCATGNGYVVLRGSLPESTADGIHYPGTYIAGVFNRLTTEVEGHLVENESLVNTPNPLLVRCRPSDGDWFSNDSCRVLAHHLELDLRHGVLTRRTRLEAADGRILAITQRRVASMRDPHIVALESTFVAENFSATLEIETALDGTVRNSGVARYHGLADDNLRSISASSHAPDAVSLEVETTGSHVRIALSARSRFRDEDGPVTTERSVVERDRYVSELHRVEVREGHAVVHDKTIAIFTSRDQGIYEPLIEARDLAASAPQFAVLEERHATSWAHAWNRCSIQLSGEVGSTERILNLHIFHLLQTTSKNSAELDVGVPARGLHGEAYRGHIFWDELFIFPFLTFRVPELTRSLLRYRARRLDAAREAAHRAGYSGAMYPWQSGSNGREETQTLHLNPKSGRWLPDASHLQRHISAAIAYNVWQYWQVTGDQEFMRFWGAEMMLEIARFWSSAAVFNPELGRYEITGVMGPDEYHEGYPDRDTPGLDNNAYTNVMAVWCLRRALDMLVQLPELRGSELLEKLGLTPQERERWDDISRRMRLCVHDDGILSQFEGYELLEEFDWDGYRARYGDIARLDRILEAEGDTPNRYKLAKQADTLMLFYLFSAEELDDLLSRLGYEMDPDFIPRNIAYYRQRTTHGSTLSHVVHAWLFSRLDRHASWGLFRSALAADINDVQGGTTAEGIHLGAMAGTVDLIQRCYGGIEARDDALHLHPVLPDELEHLRFPLRYLGHLLELEISHDQLCVHLREKKAREQAAPLTIVVRGEPHVVLPGQTLKVELRSSSRAPTDRGDRTGPRRPPDD